MHSMMTVGTPLMWILFAAFVLVALMVDFLALRKQGAHRVTLGEAAVWSLVWIAVAFVFVGWLWWYLGGLGDAAAARATANVKALEFITGYLVEKALAVDNIFVFLMVFTYFAVPSEFQKRVLMIGILGALVLRAVMILFGAYLLEVRYVGASASRLPRAWPVAWSCARASASAPSSAAEGRAQSARNSQQATVGAPRVRRRQAPRGCSPTGRGRMP